MVKLADTLWGDFLETVKQDYMSLYSQCFRESCREIYVIIGSMLMVAVFAVIQGIVTCNILRLCHYR